MDFKLNPEQQLLQDSARRYIEKACTFTPYHRATRKCPNSCTNTTMVNTNRNGIRTEKKFQIIARAGAPS